MLTQALDPTDPLLGFAVEWVRMLASRVAHLDVICLRATAPAPASNVATRAIGARTEANRLRRLIELERAAARLVPKADVVFSHMVPRYACCAGPIALAARRPIVLWYVHRRDSLELRVASAFSRFVATAMPATFPFATSKLRALGHGVDDRFFSPDPAGVSASPPLLVFVGRLTPIKGQATLLRAMSRLDPRHDDVRAVFVGGASDQRHERSLHELAARLGCSHRVTFVGSLDPGAVRGWYRRAIAAVNLSPVGFFDKAAIESMMVGVPTIVASPSFDRLLGATAPWLRVASPDDPDALAGVIDRVLALSGPARREIAGEIRRRTIDAYALDPFMDRLVALMRTAASA